MVPTRLTVDRDDEAFVEFEEFRVLVDRPEYLVRVAIRQLGCTYTVRQDSRMIRYARADVERVRAWIDLRQAQS